MSVKGATPSTLILNKIQIGTSNRDTNYQSPLMQSDPHSRLDPCDLKSSHVGVMGQCLRKVIHTFSPDDSNDPHVDSQMVTGAGQ